MSLVRRPRPLDDDLEDTRPIPKRTLEDYRSIHKLCTTIDELSAEATPWQVATRCAGAMAEALQAHAVVIHQHDPLRRELRSIGVHGPNAGDVLGTTTKVDDDHVVTAVLTNKKAMMLRLDGTLPRFVPDRHRLLGTTRSLAVVPVLGPDGCVGIIEIVGVGEERQQGVKDACELVAQRLVLALAALPSAATRTSVVISVGPRAPSSDDDCCLFSTRTRDDASPSVFPKRAPTLLCRPAR